MNRRQFLSRSLVALAAVQLGAAVTDGQWFEATKFGFDIPTNAKIDGVLCGWNQLWGADLLDGNGVDSASFTVVATGLAD